MVNFAGYQPVGDTAVSPEIENMAGEFPRTSKVDAPSMAKGAGDDARAEIETSPEIENLAGRLPVISKDELPDMENLAGQLPVSVKEETPAREYLAGANPSMASSEELERLYPDGGAAASMPSSDVPAILNGDRSVSFRCCSAENQRPRLEPILAKSQVSTSVDVARTVGGEPRATVMAGVKAPLYSSSPAPLASSPMPT